MTVDKTFWKKQKPQGQKIAVVARGWGWEEGLTAKEHKGIGKGEVE